ncbi:SMI1_KNR4 domain-containing protein [Tenacibaculum sp. 190130A14a]|uniref:SMI1_KNR4 domain-containing protein n=1 Tax=Tenacibaculum polynesiense TaxID=3137857 RepID=A0ABM9PBS9_9FLAO
MKEKQIEKLTNTPQDFKALKTASEKFWSNIELEEVYGYQIQSGSKWKEGLNEEDLEIFQKELDIEFPESLKTFYRTMNGLDKPGINILAEEEECKFGTTFYSFPDDLQEMKRYIKWVHKENNSANYDKGKVPSIIPYYSHRFLIIDKYEQVLSMYGDDIILWSDNLIQGIAQDIFDVNYRKMKTIELKPIDFWKDKVLT